MPTIAPYGSWKSPLGAEKIASKSLGLGQIAVEGEEIYWSENRAAEEGRMVIVCRLKNGETVDVTPEPFNVRTRVHEYGGGAYLVYRGTVYYSNFSDQRLYRQKPGSIPFPLTPSGERRYADGVFDINRNSLVCVCEDHTGSEVRNTLVRVDVSGVKSLETLAAGNDFYASPRISPDGARIAWLAWDHPNMPWDSSYLWSAETGTDGTFKNVTRVAGGPDESICQPEYSPEGDLYFVSDRSGWWNLYRWKKGSASPVCSMQAEFGVPHWTFAESRYAFLPGNRLLCIYIRNGVSFLGRLDLKNGQMETIKCPYTWMDSLHISAGKAVMIAGSPQRSSAVVRLDPDSGKEEVFRLSNSLSPGPGYIANPQEIEYPAEEGRTAHAFYYPPTNQDFAGPSGELPPLLVFSHGGPTSAASSVLNFSIQYWTSRGLAVANVNYGGSAGFGRAYRQRLNGRWGVVDVDDCVNCSRYLVQQGLADPERLAIRGGSAGGYTTLAALTFRSFFKAGASYYGVSDLESLARDTHKFESHYEDILVGPYPERRDLYIERSPINSVELLSCPVIFFQGTEDKIVPPSQSEMMVEALRRKGIPVAYLLFEHEQHGFRQASSIRRSLEAELYFYSKILGFALADPVEPVRIENLAAS
jgi:dipeptidyl aminopeptidase/acylaminoacyl peptidase